MRTLMSQAAWVHYGQIYVQSGEDYPDLAECFAGQSNGVCAGVGPPSLRRTSSPFGSGRCRVVFSEVRQAFPALADE